MPGKEAELAKYSTRKRTSIVKILRQEKNQDKKTRTRKEPGSEKYSDPEKDLKNTFTMKSARPFPLLAASYSTCTLRRQIQKEGAIKTYVFIKDSKRKKYLNMLVVVGGGCNSSSQTSSLYSCALNVHGTSTVVPSFQCCGSGSLGSICFWASRIRIH